MCVAAFLPENGVLVPIHRLSLTACPRWIPVACCTGCNKSCARPWCCDASCHALIIPRLPLVGSTVRYYTCPSGGIENKLIERMSRTLCVARLALWWQLLLLCLNGRDTFSSGQGIQFGPCSSPYMYQLPQAGPVRHGDSSETRGGALLAGSTLCL